MTAAPAFCRLVLGDDEAAARAAAAAAPGADRVEEVAGAWLACAPALAARSDALAWGEAHAPADREDVVAALPALGDRERAAVVAQALGLEPAEVEAALGEEPGAAPALLARAHAGLAGLGLPASEECARERERLAIARKPRSAHCEACRALAAAVPGRRRALERAAAPPRPSGEGRRDAPGAAPGRLVQAAAALAVLLAAGAAGFGVVSAFERDRGKPGVVTATPVGPLPPGVGPGSP